MVIINIPVLVSSSVHSWVSKESPKGPPSLDPLCSASNFFLIFFLLAWLKWRRTSKWNIAPTRKIIYNVFLKYLQGWLWLSPRNLIVLKETTTKNKHNGIFKLWLSLTVDQNSWDNIKIIPMGQCRCQLLYLKYFKHNKNELRWVIFGRHLELFLFHSMDYIPGWLAERRNYSDLKTAILITKLIGLKQKVLFS